MLDEKVEARFWPKMELRNDGCWWWTGAIDGHGYGSFRVNNKTQYAYHVSWEMFNGSRTKGLDLDHTCRNRPCINPAHLEQVTRGENLKRSPLTQTSINMAKTHCVHGHEYTDTNTLRSTKGWRLCRICRDASNAIHNAARKATK